MEESLFKFDSKKSEIQARRAIGIFLVSEVRAVLGLILIDQDSILEEKDYKINGYNTVFPLKSKED